MPPLLGAADSFNSSSATIRADSGPDQRNYRTSNSNALGPQDSVGREFEALIGGRIGLLQNDAGVGSAEVLSRFLRENRTLPGELSLSELNNTNNNHNGNCNGNGNGNETDLYNLIADPSAPDISLFADAQFPPTEPASTLDNLSTGATFVTTSAGANFQGSAPPFERPGSALSHRSQHSDYSCSTTEGSGSYVTTDDDGDLDMQTSASPSPLHELRALNLGSTSAAAWGMPMNGINQTITPSAQALGSSARNVPSTPGSVANSSASRRRSHAVSFGPDDEEDQRQQRLEHRRSINRRSAQKHRLRRKEELDDLTRQVAERDSRIQELERKLAVAEGNLATLMSLVQRGKQSE